MKQSILENIYPQTSSTSFHNQWTVAHFGSPEVPVPDFSLLPLFSLQISVCAHPQDVEKRY